MESDKNSTVIIPAIFFKIKNFVMGLLRKFIMFLFYSIAIAVILIPVLSASIGGLLIILFLSIRKNLVFKMPAKKYSQPVPNAA